jgi:hypothetical protein
VIAVRLLLAIWEAPQNLLGALLFAFAKLTGGVHHVAFEDERVIVESSSLGICLGLFVFYNGGENRYFLADPLMRQHEYGHSIQSRYLGPTYLPIVGVTSTLRVIYSVLYRESTGKRWRGYFDGFPEHWADRLGKIEPEERRRQLGTS